MDVKHKLLKYGVRDGKLLHILEVATGLECECICPNPACNHQLVAKNNPNNYKQPHFAHHKGMECDAAYESALHLLAKATLAKLKQLMIPAYVVKNDTLQVRSKRLVDFDTIELEVPISKVEASIIPDAIGKKAEAGRQHELLIEFAVTHYVDEVKKEKLKALGLSCIEIDLAGLPLDEEELILLLTTESERKYWISNPKLEAEAKDKQARLIEWEKERDKKAWANAQQRMIEYAALGHKVFFDTKVSKICPKKMQPLSELKNTNFYRHPILKRIIDGEPWNLKIYPDGKDGKYIFIKKERIQVIPTANEQKLLTDEEVKSIRLLYAGLKSINFNLDRPSSSNCSTCFYSIDWLIAGEQAFQVCSHP